MTIHLERAKILIQQRRVDDAQKELMLALADQPDHGETLYLLAYCFNAKHNTPEALNFIGKAIALQPDNDLYYYLFSRILFDADKLVEAQDKIDHAIELNPFDADYFGVAALIRLNRKEYQSALEKANEGLQIDPENQTCLNTRSTSLVKLNKKAEAFSTIQTALEKDPGNSYTHANYGWGLLEKGDHKKALIHFRESLKLKPDNEYAQSGMVQALKAKYWIYRMFLKYAFWIGNMKGKLQWALIIGFYLGIRLLSTVAQQSPELRKIILPIIILYAVFAISTWIISPLFNIMLLLNPYGRYALKKDERRASYFTGSGLLVALIGLLLYLLLQNELYLLITGYGVTMMIPLASMFHRGRKNKDALKIYAGVMAGTGLIAIYTSFSTGELFNTFSTIYLIAFIAYQWIANALVSRS